MMMISSVRRFASTSPPFFTRVGLEIHLQLLTATKLFSDAPNIDGIAHPNSAVTPFDAAHPGTLPVLNRQAVVQAIRAAHVFNCTINEVSYFDRKHYFYFDMPAGYQITQQRVPVAQNGCVPFYVTHRYDPGSGRTYSRSSRIERIQLEQDSGKSIHDAHDEYTLIDLNRAGAPLIELVTAPDLCDGAEAACLAREVQLLAQAAGISRARMNVGQMRVDANVSTHVREDGRRVGEKVEIKNLTGIRFVERAVLYEAKRQIQLAETGREIVSQTRFYDVKANKTRTLRDKELLHDYRFLPEPNLPPLRLTRANGGDIDRSRTVDIDSVQIDNFHGAHDVAVHWIKLGAEPEYAARLTHDDECRELTMKILKQHGSELQAGSLIAQFIAMMYLCMRPALSAAVDATKLVQAPFATWKELSELYRSDLVGEDALRRIVIRTVLADPTGRTPSEIVRDEGCQRFQNEDERVQFCKEFLDHNEQFVLGFKSGNRKNADNILYKLGLACVEKSKYRMSDTEARRTLRDILISL